MLTSEVIALSPQRVGHGIKSNVAELLIRDQYALSGADRFYCFSKYDLISVGELPDPPPVELAASHHFGWYAQEDRVASEDRRAIERYFVGTATDFPAHLDCDRIRPKPKHLQGVDREARCGSEEE